MRPVRTISVLTILLAPVIALAHADDAPEEPETPAPPPCMGDWLGTWQRDSGDGVPLAAQVVALDDGELRVRFTPNVRTALPPFAVVAGHAAGGRCLIAGVAAEGPAAGTAWAATAEAHVMAGRVVGAKGGPFRLAPVLVESPSLGAPPPEGAIVLFDGEHLSAWGHRPEKPWIAQLRQLEEEDTKDAVAYLRTEVHAPRALEARLDIGSDDGVKAWLNGEMIHSKNVARGFKPDSDNVDIRLSEGWNLLMLKIDQGERNWAACARIRSREGRPLDGLRSRRPGEEEAVNLADEHGFITLWDVSGPYRKEGKVREELHDLAFAPETGPEGADWKPMPITDQAVTPAGWRVTEDGAMEVVPGTGSLASNREFGDHRIHVEFRTPYEPDALGQARANSGVYVQGRYEVQILDSYGVEPTDVDCGAIYKVAAPKLNMSAPPLQWQTLDITLRAPRFDARGDMTEVARMTVLHNGVEIHRDVELDAVTGGSKEIHLHEPGPLLLQDHRSPVQFRSIWVVETTE